MTPTLLTFCDERGDLRYVILNNVEVIRFANKPNIFVETMTVRYMSGEVINYELRAEAGTAIKNKLNQFGL